MRFRLFRFPVTISPTFLFLGVFLIGSNLGWKGIAAWVSAAFSSVLIHELGHAFAVRRAEGMVQGITLHALGGATAWADPNNRITWSKRIGIAAAGAGLGFLVAGFLFGLVRLGVFGESAAQIIQSPFKIFFGDAAAAGLWLVFFLGAFIWVSIAWGLINWLPIGGLDGWHILAELLERWFPGRGRMTAAMIGVLVALGVGWFFLRIGLRFGAIVLVLFSIQTLMAERARTARAADQLPTAPDVQPPVEG